MEISYIIVSHNSQKYIATCIDSIIGQSYINYEIIVIDNNSVDNTKSIVTTYQEKNKQIKLVSNTENIGYSKGITMGFRISRGKFLAILNADAFLEHDWSDSMIEAFESNPEIMCASGTILFPNGELQSAGGMMDKYGAVVQRNSKIFHDRKIKVDALFYCEGSTFMVRRKILEEISFDSNLFMYYEDVDFSWKIRMLGYQIAHVPKSISYHDVGHSFYDVTPSKFYYMARNRLYLLQKNYSLRNFISRNPVVVFLIFLNAITYDLSKKPKGFTLKFFKAMFWNIAIFRSIMKERKAVWSKNKIADDDLNKHLIPYSIEISLIKKTKIWIAMEFLVSLLHTKT